MTNISRRIHLQSIEKYLPSGTQSQSRSKPNSLSLNFISDTQSSDQFNPHRTPHSLVNRSPSLLFTNSSIDHSAHSQPPSIPDHYSKTTKTLSSSPAPNCRQTSSSGLKGAGLRAKHKKLGAMRVAHSMNSRRSGSIILPPIVIAGWTREKDLAWPYCVYTNFWPAPWGGHPNALLACQSINRPRLRVCSSAQCV